MHSTWSVNSNKCVKLGSWYESQVVNGLPAAVPAIKNLDSLDIHKIKPQ